MRYIFKFPDIGEGLDEGTIAEWYVEKGHRVEAGQPLVKMETDKVVTDIPSPKSGVIAAIFGKVGETIHVGNPLVEIEIEGVAGEQAVEEARKDFTTEPIEEGASVVGTMEVAGNAAFLPAGDEGFPAQEKKEKPAQRKALATPVARAMAKELNIDINDVAGTGPAGRVTINDIKKAHLSLSSIQKTAVKVAETPDRISFEPLTQIRKAIIRNMTVSKQTIPHMTVHEEVEVSELVRIREKYRQRLAEEQIRLSFLPFIIRAVAQSLAKFKVINAQLDLENERIIYKNYINIGIAVDTPDGLVVPVIKDANTKSIKAIAQELNEISFKARERGLKLEDMKDGTFTITNYGSIGGLWANPIINHPQSAILGVGRMIKKPVIKDNQVQAGIIQPLSLAVDHRIVDGGEVTRFLNQVMEYLSDPVSLILD